MPVLKGPRHELSIGSDGYPEALARIGEPPERLYVVGDPESLEQGLAVIGARKATPYGLSCAKRFARIASEKGVVIISGGARGCDSASHRAALEAGGRTVVFLGGGCDELYPPEHGPLFQRVVDAGGAVVSEHDWSFRPLPFTFRMRNRLIAGLASAVLIVEAGLPSGTFSTADAALDAGKEVLVVPGSITSAASRGSNRLLLQGAVPVVDDESFEDALFDCLGALKRPGGQQAAASSDEPILEAIRAQPSSVEELFAVARQAYGESEAQAKLMEALVGYESAHLAVRYPDGRWGTAVSP